MVVTVFREAVKRRYLAPWLSLSCFFNLVIIVGILLIPLFVGLASGNFWIKRGFLFEQPNIRFAYDLVVIFRGFSGDVGNQQITTWAWATKPARRKLYQQFLRSSVVRAWSIDDNQDGVADTWHLTVQMPIEQNDRVQTVQMMALFDYSLSGNVQLNMDGLAFVEYSNAIPGSSLSIETEARLRQFKPLSVRRENALPENNIPELTDSLGPESIRDQSLQAIAASYAKRTFSMQLANTQPVWQPVNSFDTYSITSDSFLLNFTMRVPMDDMQYTPNLAEVLKFAWVQYYTLAAIFYFILMWIKSFVFTNQVLESVVAREGLYKVKQF